MGQIVSSYDILPESTDIDLNTVIETIGTDLENALTSIPGIQNVECVSSTNY